MTKRKQKRQRPGNPAFYAALEELAAMHQRKSSDYGSTDDPLANIRASVAWGVEAWRAALVRLGDKIARLQTFAQRGTLLSPGGKITG
jgi:hypothetical protein